MKLVSLSSISALIAGILFGIGLVISGMTDTHKVIGFLDIADWDYDLLFVMVGAIAVSVIPYNIYQRFKKPVFEKEFQIPTNNIITKKLIIGAILFGIGWGLYGLCPAPAVVALLYGNTTIYLFFAAMIAGFYLSDISK